MTATDVVIYGASGHANAVRCAIEAQGLARVVAFIDDYRGEEGATVGNRPVVSFERWRGSYRTLPCLIAVGETRAKRRLADRIAQAGGTFCRLYDASDMAEVTVGAGSFLGPSIYVGPNTTIGEHVFIMPMTSVGHDVTIESYSTVCPSCSIGGHVTLESGAFIGAGSTIINGKVGQPLVIGARATIAAGAVVTKSVAPDTTVMGNPAQPLRRLAATRNAMSGGT